MEKKKPSGRAATHNVSSKYLSQSYENVHLEGIDSFEQDEASSTQFYTETVKKAINKVPSVDLNFDYSVNPYQGCEHGCSYCYARPTHEFWGYSAGKDFEQKIIVKHNIVEKVEEQLLHKSWKVSPIMLSGNTDCYQPAERKYGLTRDILALMLKYKHPVSIITKNSLILRDLDILSALAEQNLIRVNMSICTGDEELRRYMEPRTSSIKNRFKAIQLLSEAGIPTQIMMAPIIAGLNSHEIPQLLERSSKAGAENASYTVLRLNGAVEQVFKDWLQTYFPNKYNKVISQSLQNQGGNFQHNNQAFRMKGKGEMATSIKQLFNWARAKHFPNAQAKPLNTALFRPNPEQLSLDF